MPAQTVIQLRRDTSANWESADPILASGEAGFDTTENKIKIGDGTSTWTELDYASGGSGSITVSETAPADPAEGDLWFNSTNAVTYIYYDSFWVELTPAIAGPEGATGATGEPGIVVQDEEPTNTDVLWLDSDDPADAVAVPAGGETGQVLAKATDDDYDTEWTTLPEAPTPVSSGNAIINGAFEINQRGFTTGTANGQFVADRFPQLVLSASGFTSSLVANVGGADLPENIPNLVTMAGTLSDAANGAIVMSHRVENVSTLAGQNAVLSFYAKGSAAGTIGVRVAQSFGSGGSSSVSVLQTTQAITTDFVRYEFTFAMPSISGKTLGAGHNIFIAIDKNMGTAIIGGGYAPVFTGTLSITGLQLEAGSTATEFRRNANSIQGELAACQRYYWQSNAGSLFQSFASGMARSSTAGIYTLINPVTMRVAPTSLTVSAIGVLNGSGGFLAATGAAIVQAGAVSSTIDISVASGLTSGQGSLLTSANTTNGLIGVSAEL
jgi:hypothetical protein